MGLDFSHGEAHWSYSGFHRFRVELAAAIGVDLDQMQGFGGEISWENVNNPIIPLLNHSDCDGELSPEECRQIAPKLKEIVSNWPEDDYDRRQAERLAEAMETCANEGDALEFC